MVLSAHSLTLYLHLQLLKSLTVSHRPGRRQGCPFNLSRDLDSDWMAIFLSNSMVVWVGEVLMRSRCR